MNLNFLVDKSFILKISGKRLVCDNSRSSIRDQARDALKTNFGDQAGVSVLFSYIAAQIAKMSPFATQRPIFSEIKERLLVERWKKVVIDYYRKTNVSTNRVGKK